MKTGRRFRVRKAPRTANCKRACPGPPRFEVRDTTVIDRLTRLEWRKDTIFEGRAMGWEEALRTVARLNRETSDTWRLPNINELESLVDCARHTPALPPEHPFTRTEEVYWSSTTSMYIPEWAWALYLHKSAVGVGKNRRVFRLGDTRWWLVTGRRRTPSVVCSGYPKTRSEVRFRGNECALHLT